MQSFLGPMVVLGMVFIFPFFLIMFNRHRIKGKLLAFIARKDKSVLPRLCELRDDFMVFQNRAYDVYPDFIRLCRYPMGWPAFLQELVPAGLYDEEDAIPKDWIHPESEVQVRAMELRSALDENWLRKLVEETSREGGTFGINWRKALPIILLIVGVIGIAAIFLLRKKVGG